jgi:hypothetical protein
MDEVQGAGRKLWQWFKSSGERMVEMTGRRQNGEGFRRRKDRVTPHPESGTLNPKQLTSSMNQASPSLFWALVSPPVK